MTAPVESEAALWAQPGEPLPPVMGIEPLSDITNGRLFARMFQNQLRYVQGLGWLYWNGARWLRDDGRVIQLAKDLILHAGKCAFNIDDDDCRKRHAAHWNRSASAARIKSMQELAASEPDVYAVAEDLDSDPFLFNTATAVVDLRTGVARKARPGDLITKLAPVAYDAGATAPTWDRFIATIQPDPAKREYLQRACGYTLTGDTREHAFFAFLGNGSNGKSVLIDVLLSIFGDYAFVAPPTVLLLKRDDGGVSNDLAALAGRRLVVVQETAAGRRLNESAVKNLTSGDKMSARFLYKEFFDFHPICKPFLVTNHRPLIDGTDDGIWRRIRLLSFDQSFVDANDPRLVSRRPGFHLKDAALKDKLRAEYPGILNWLIAGCLAWQRDGLGEPASIRSALDEYRTEMDPLAGFFTDHCEFGVAFEAKTSDLFDAYSRWARFNGVPSVDKRQFISALPHRGLERTRIGARKDRGWSGVRLKTNTEGSK